MRYGLVWSLHISCLWCYKHTEEAVSDCAAKTSITIPVTQNVIWLFSKWERIRIDLCIWWLFFLIFFLFVKLKMFCSILHFGLLSLFWSALRLFEFLDIIQKIMIPLNFVCVFDEKVKVMRLKFWEDGFRIPCFF